MGEALGERRTSAWPRTSDIDDFRPNPYSKGNGLGEENLSENSLEDTGINGVDALDLETTAGVETTIDIPLPGIHKHVYLRRSPVEGLGLVARRIIRGGETVWKGPSPVGVAVTTSAIQRMSPEEQDHIFHYFYQISETEFFGPPTEADVLRDGSVFNNHNCDPNIGWVSPFEMVAIRDIQPGKELTFDYATSETWEGHPPLECCCGATNCRRIIRYDSDYLLPDVQARLGQYYMPYVKAKLALCKKRLEARLGR